MDPFTIACIAVPLVLPIPFAATGAWLIQTGRRHWLWPLFASVLIAAGTLGYVADTRGLGSQTSTPGPGIAYFVFALGFPALFASVYFSRRIPQMVGREAFGEGVVKGYFGVLVGVPLGIVALLFALE